MTDPLAKLFGSAARVKLLRLFLFNPAATYTAPDAANRARVPERTARAEIKLFELAGLIKCSRSRGARWGLNTGFMHLEALQALMLNSAARRNELYKELRHAGAIKLIVVAGSLVGNWEGRLDLLIVGDRMHERTLRTKIRALEAELGTELRYALLSTPDFSYRLTMGDRLVRDVLDFPHSVVYDRLHLGVQ